MNLTTISECKEPWLFWWALLPKEDKKALKQKYFSTVAPHFPCWLLEHEIAEVWQFENPDPLCDLDWLELARGMVDFPTVILSNSNMKREIWRQVYRISADRI